MKRLMLLIITILLLGAVALPAAAVPVADLTALASYYPDTTLLYAAARTDDDFIATLDGLLAQVGGALPEFGGVTLASSLDELASDIKTGATFQQLYRSWFGATAAIGILPPSAEGQPDEVIALIVVSITNRDAAEAYFQSVTRPRDYQQTTGDGFTTYEHLNSDTHVAFRDDVMLVASDFSAIETGGVVAAPLSGVATFTDTFALLPQSDYNAAIYLDTPAWVALIDEMNDGGSVPLAILVAEAGLNVVAAQAFGLTILDERSLTIDAVTSLSDDTVLPGIMTTPLDLALIERIPAGTPLVILGSNFSDSVNTLVSQAAQFAEQAQLTSENDDIGIAVWMVEFFVRGFTGMNLLDEILPALNGTYALYAGVNPAAEGAQSVLELVMPDLLFDFALTFQISDPAVAAELRANLSTTLHNLPEERQDNLTVWFDEINGTEVFGIAVETNPFSGEQVEFMLAVSDAVFTFGTPRYVEAALNPGVGLDQDPQWQEAAQYLVPGAYSVLYQSSDNLATLGSVLAQDMASDAAQAGESILGLTQLISSSSISYAPLDEGGVQMRAVLTLTSGE